MYTVPKKSACRFLSRTSDFLPPIPLEEKSSFIVSDEKVVNNKEDDTMRYMTEQLKVAQYIKTLGELERLNEIQRLALIEGLSLSESDLRLVPLSNFAVAIVNDPGLYERYVEIMRTSYTKALEKEIQSV